MGMGNRESGMGNGPGIRPAGHSRFPDLHPSPISAPALPARWVSWLLAAFILLGVAVRLNRYLLRFPLWGDEACLAVNLIDRGYAGLLRPLDYYPVAPPCLLWAVKTATSLFGFNEYALRLFPFACGLLSVWIFYRAAGSVLAGLPLLLSTAIFAVAYYPVRHGAEIKQYSCDLFVSLVLLRLALGYLTRPRPAAWFWGLCLFTPFALALSYPAVFVAGGIGIALICRAGQIRSAESAGRLSVYLLFVLGSFGFVYFTFIRTQLNFELAALNGRHMFTIWEGTFPPLARPGRLILWLISAHTGRMFAYPVGGEHGGSVVTLVCFLAGLAAFRRRNDWALVFLFAGPFLPALIAAALRRYPYGYSARWMLYLAPFICIPAGLGAADLISRIKACRWRRWATVVVLAVLGLVGLGTIVRDLARPYKEKADRDSRAFARSFWSADPGAGRLFCLKADLGEDVFPGLFVTDHNAARYLCNREICYPARIRPSLAEVKKEWSGGKKFDLVVYSVPGYPRDERKFLGRLEALRRWADLTGCRSYDVNSDSPLHRERYEVYEFTGR